MKAIGIGYSKCLWSAYLLVKLGSMSSHVVFGGNQMSGDQKVDEIFVKTSIVERCGVANLQTFGLYERRFTYSKKSLMKYCTKLTVFHIHIYTLHLKLKCGQKSTPKSPNAEWRRTPPSRLLNSWTLITIQHTHWISNVII